MGYKGEELPSMIWESFLPPKIIPLDLVDKQLVCTSVEDVGMESAAFGVVLF